MIVGFAGRVGSGKDFASKVLSQMLEPKVTRFYKFAQPMKDFCAEIFGWSHEHLEGDLKEVPNDQGISPRQALQRLGTEWGRKIDSGCWARYTCRKIKKDLEKPSVQFLEADSGVSSYGINRVDVALVTDLRFINEARALKNLGGWIVYLVGDENYTEHNKHASESEVVAVRDMADLVIDNRQRNERLLMLELEKLL